MIASFRSKALKRLWEKSDGSKLPARFVEKISLALDTLNAATAPEDLDLPGFGFHALTGNRKGQYSLVISKNWRITFRWDDGDAVDVDYEDYHGK